MRFATNTGGVPVDLVVKDMGNLRLYKLSAALLAMIGHVYISRHFGAWPIGQGEER
jgi:hypothetical protein